MYKLRIAYAPPQPLLGALSHIVAATTHYVAPARLGRIAQTVPKVSVVSADEDYLIASAGSVRLIDGLLGESSGKKEGQNLTNVESVKWKNTGHAAQIQWPGKFNVMLERIFHEGQESADRAEDSAIGSDLKHGMYYSVSVLRQCAQCVVA